MDIGKTLENTPEYYEKLFLKFVDFDKKKIK